MTFKEGDKVVVTGPPVLPGMSVEESYISLEPGQIVTVEDVQDDSVRVDGGGSDQFYIAASSLTLYTDH